MSTPTSNIPAVFEARKNKILEELSLPDAEYTDASPKGSVDEGIRDLIRDINAVPGLVTTSSCAGRISVFLEGRKKSDTSVPEAQAPEQAQRQFAQSGGKGTGRWLYVSHDPLILPEINVASSGVGSFPLHDQFDLVPGDGKPPAGKALQLVRFHFEPLILHIMAATLHQAQPVLAIAAASGFRESGLQGLRCLEGEDGPSPVVAVRSSGLSLESVIGYYDDKDGSAAEPVIRSLVTEEYLEMLVKMANERFAVNADRRERFRVGLLKTCSPDQTQFSGKGKGKGKPVDWEDPVVRKERMRAEGLMRKKLLDSQKAPEPAGQDLPENSVPT
ncbi:uncharacterized protein N7484_001065 [Penicillium longicatenatum]|uniref:uncharacterized protein n=1 Tax=Penicillium longicatenatum TaxID=1561947 RepID=UPI0025491F03|nr:uncharacterized protein N7484_001065 [Penicillium longicatenatum]KAJ5657416.1 hypothetical protein N7484_001065 [Penicillium longicatenatum]